MKVQLEGDVASFVRRIKNVDRKLQGFRKRKIDLEVLRQDILDYPDAYHYERAKRLVWRRTLFLWCSRSMA